VAGRPPFLNVSDLAGERLDEVLRHLEGERRRGVCARVFGSRYMDLRRRTEEKLRSLFIEAGGRPVRRAPHYFVLGSSPWFKGLAGAMEEVVLPLSALPTEVSSVTYPDSFTSMAFGPDYGLPYERRPYHERVYRLEELPGLIDTYGLPADPVDGGGGGGDDGDPYRGYEKKAFEMYVEVQLWSDGPLDI
jgi:hypothetical protein